MDVDWDLHAVVRGCATVTTTSNRGGVVGNDSFTADLYPQSRFSFFDVQQEPFRFEANNPMEELHELYKPFFPKSEMKPQQELQQVKPKQSHASSVTTTSTSHNPRSKRRKNQLKRVCQVPAEGLSSDVWAWRKYGQKPIKGSPYPRGYYRCSSSKGCLARKQVERHRSDPNMFIVTYTAEHNHPAPTHRNSLAGSTRQKPLTPQAVTSGDSIKTSCSKPADSLSPTTSVDEEVVVQSRQVDIREDFVEDEFGMSDTAVSDDFFEGLDGIAEMVAGDSFSDEFPASFDFPWIAKHAGTAACGI